jgi:oligopeptide/dipeptide ABC transporter ATP-binding protein
VERPVTAVTPAPAPASAEPAAVLEVRDLSVRFRPRGREVHAVSGLSYSVPAGRTVAIIGESGSGKTASSRAVMGLLPRSAQVSGSVLLGGTELIGLGQRELRRHRGADVAMIFQDPARSLNPTMKVGPQIAEAVRAHRKVSKAEARDRAIELFRLVRLSAPEQRYDEYPHQFSGGMRQRVMIAMALSCSPKLLIADEATTALDVTTQAQIMRLLTELQARLGMAILMISHDLGLAASVADEVVVMYAGRTVERAPSDELFGHVRMPYTGALLGAVPRLDRPAHTPLPVIGGRPPDLAAEITGCPFAPRCPRAAAQCTAERPPLAEVEPGHWYACWYPLPDSAQPGAVQPGAAQPGAAQTAAAQPGAAQTAAAQPAATGEAR